MQKTISSVRAVRNHQVCRRGRGGVSNRVRDDQQLVQNGRHQAKVFGEEFIEEFISDLKQSVRSEIGKKTTIDRRTLTWRALRSTSDSPFRITS